MHSGREYVLPSMLLGGWLMRMTHLSQMRCGQIICTSFGAPCAVSLGTDGCDENMLYASYDSNNAFYDTCVIG